MWYLRVLGGAETHRKRVNHIDDWGQRRGYRQNRLVRQWRKSAVLSRHKSWRVVRGTGVMEARGIFVLALVSPTTDAGFPGLQRVGQQRGANTESARARDVTSTRPGAFPKKHETLPASIPRSKHSRESRGPSALTWTADCAIATPSRPAPAAITSAPLALLPLFPIALSLSISPVNLDLWRGVDETAGFVDDDASRRRARVIRLVKQSMKKKKSRRRRGQRCLVGTLPADFCSLRSLFSVLRLSGILTKPTLQAQHFTSPPGHARLFVRYSRWSRHLGDTVGLESWPSLSGAQQCFTKE